MLCRCSFPFPPISFLCLRVREILKDTLFSFDSSQPYHVVCIASGCIAPAFLPRCRLQAACFGWLTKIIFSAILIHFVSGTSSLNGLKSFEVHVPKRTGCHFDQLSSWEEVAARRCLSDVSGYAMQKYQYIFKYALTPKICIFVHNKTDATAFLCPKTCKYHQTRCRHT